MGKKAGESSLLFFQQTLARISGGHARAEELRLESQRLQKAINQTSKLVKEKKNTLPVPILTVFAAHQKILEIQQAELAIKLALHSLPRYGKQLINKKKQ